MTETTAEKIFGELNKLRTEVDKLTAENHMLRTRCCLTEKFAEEVARLKIELKACKESSK